MPIAIPALQGTPMAARYEVGQRPRLDFQESGPERSPA